MNYDFLKSKSQKIQFNKNATKMQSLIKRDGTKTGKLHIFLER